ncbi:hypothetical protein OROGR_009951 [Orobanche gracilis]
MVSDSLLVNRLQEIIRDSDLETSTATSIRRRLEEEFSVDLYGRRSLIREQIDLFLQGMDDRAEREEEVVDENAQNDAVEEVPQQRETGNENVNSQEEEIPQEDEEEKEGVSNDGRLLNTDAKKKGGGFSKSCALSPQLEKFCGVAELARTEVVKKIWAYIREQNLQNPVNRRKILCDESLHEIFRVKSIDMFQMNKVLSKHIWPLDEAQAAQVKSSQSERHCKQRKEGSDEPKRREKPKKGSGGLTTPLPLSDALVKFFGTGKFELSRADVVKKMWAYIKENELQDPSDKRMVLCDKKLKELFGVDSFHGFTVSKLLASHFIKTQG